MTQPQPHTSAVGRRLQSLADTLNQSVHLLAVRDGVIATNRLGWCVRDDSDMQVAAESLLADEGVWSETGRRCVTFLNEQYGDEIALKEYESAFRSLDESVA